MQASLLRLVDFVRAANGLARAGRAANPFRANIGITGYGTVATFTTGRAGASWALSDRLYESPAERLGMRRGGENMRETEKVRVRRRGGQSGVPVTLCSTISGDSLSAPGPDCDVCYSIYEHVGYGPMVAMAAMDPYSI
jgi:hypothetical protein